MAQIPQRYTNTASQARAYRLYASSLLHINIIQESLIDLVKILASCSIELVYITSKKNFFCNK